MRTLPANRKLDAGPLTVMATRTARRGREAQFAAHLDHLCEVLTRQPGHQDTAILAPVAPRRDAVVLYRFDTPGDLEAWHRSSARAELLAASAELTEDTPHERAVSGLDAWFATTGGRVVRPPARWKTWVISSAAIWTLLTAMTFAAGPMLGMLAMPLRFAIVVPVLSALMTWLIMPTLTRWLAGWLFAHRRRQRPCA